MRARPKRWSPLGVVAAACLLPAVAGCTVIPERAPAITDSRACSGSNVALDEVAAHFGLTLPPDAGELRFESDVHPLFGEYTLKVTFTTASADDFLRASQLPDLSRPQTVHLRVTAPPCAGLADGELEPVAADERAGALRSVVIQAAGPRARVIVSAQDF